MSERIYYSQEAEMQANRDKALVTIAFLVIGLSIGTVLAILLAPKSGKEIRENLAHAFEDGLSFRREPTRIERLEKEIAELRKAVEKRFS